MLVWHAIFPHTVILYSPPPPPYMHTTHAHHSVRSSRAMKTVHLTENEVRNLCLKSREVFLSQPILLELEAPIKICGGCVLKP